jgi:hypothetical protein
MERLISSPPAHRIASPLPASTSTTKQNGTTTDLLTLLKKAKQDSKTDISPQASPKPSPKLASTPPAHPMHPSIVTHTSISNLPYPGAHQNPLSPYSPTSMTPQQPQAPMNPLVPMHSLDEMCIFAEALPPAAPRGTLSKLELAGRLVFLLSDSSFLNNVYDRYLSAPK